METTTQTPTNGAAVQPPIQQPAQLAPRQREPLPFVPQNIDQAWRIAEVISKSNLLPDALRGRPYDVMLIIMLGAEFGIQPMTSLREIYVVKGQPRMSALLKSALVRSSPACEFLTMIESTDQRATFETKRRGDKSPVRMSYTIEQATRAGLAGQPPREGKEPSNWDRRPALMLRRRCVSELCDEVFPDETRGFPGSENEENDRAESARVVGRGTTSAPPIGQAPDPFGLDAPANDPPQPTPTAQAETRPVDAPAVTHSEAVKLAGGITSSEVAKIPPAPVQEDPIETLLTEIKACKTVGQIDKLMDRAQAVDGPRRSEVGKALSEQRLAVKGGGK